VILEKAQSAETGHSTPKFSRPRRAARFSPYQLLCVAAADAGPLPADLVARIDRSLDRARKV